MTKKLSLGLVVLALLAGPVHAQKKGGPAEPTPEELQQKRDAAALDKQYKDTLRRTGQEAAPAKVDPWANLRGNDNSNNNKR